MQINNIVGSEIHEVVDIGVTEMEADYRKCDWSCWTQAVPFLIAVIGGIYVIVKLAVIIRWQLDANLI